MLVALFNVPVLNALTVTLAGTSTKAPLASVTLSVKVLVVAAVGVAEKTTLKLPPNVSGIWPATLGAVNVTGLTPLTVQVSIALAADTSTREYESLANVHPAGILIATLLAEKQPLLVTVNVSSVFMLPALVEVGETVMLVPLPTSVPPHEPLYHWNEAPVPRLPPDNVSVDELPPTMSAGDAEAPVGGIDCVLDVTVVLAQVVVLAVPSART